MLHSFANKARWRSHPDVTATSLMHTAFERFVATSRQSIGRYSHLVRSHLHGDFQDPFYWRGGGLSERDEDMQEYLTQGSNREGPLSNCDLSRPSFQNG